MTTPTGTLDVEPSPVSDVDPAGVRRPGPAEQSLIDSVDAARRAKTLTPHDDAAVYAARAVARSLDQAIAYGAQLDAVIKGTTALRHWFTALNLTPAARERDNSFRDVPTEPEHQGTDWTADYGAPALVHTADP